MKKLFASRYFSIAVFITVLVSAYFINVEVQSYLGKQALEKTGLKSYPFEQALDKAKAENKLVLVEVSAIWCSTCRKLDNEIFADKEVRRVINENFVFSRLEYETEEGQKFLERYKTSGFPNLWLLDGDGRVARQLNVTFDRGEFLWQLYRDKD